MPGSYQYMDANVLLSYVLKEEDRFPTVGELLRESERGDKRLVTSTVSIVEVARGAEDYKGDSLDPGAFVAIDTLWDGGSPVVLREASIDVMFKARDLQRRAHQTKKVQNLDSIHIATAMVLEAEVLYTYEKQSTREWWAELSGIRVEEPQVNQPPML